MSDAGRKMDVEDVLSSIRRLVSEEARTAVSETASEAVPEEPKTEAEPAIDRPEKLVLTPAFRVSDVAAPVAEEAHQEFLQAPMGTAKQEPIFPTNEVEAPFSDVEDPEMEVQSDEPAPTPDPSPETTDRTDIESAVESITPVEMPTFEAPETAQENPVLEIAPEEQEAPVSETTPIEQTATVEELPEEIEPATELDAPVPEFDEASNGYESIDYTIDPDSYLDEEALRELVSQMVRSELQGELGDRITRNVRKLVRREIHRALASRDFE